MLLIYLGGQETQFILRGMCLLLLYLGRWEFSGRAKARTAESLKLMEKAESGWFERKSERVSPGSFGVLPERFEAGLLSSSGGWANVFWKIANIFFVVLNLLFFFLVYEINVIEVDLYRLVWFVKFWHFRKIKKVDVEMTHDLFR